MHTTSPTLLAKLRETDQPEAWDRFVSLYGPMLLAWASRQGLSGHDAEDLTQEVLIKLLQLLRTFQRDEGQSFRAWLFVITRNQCLDFRRRKATRALPIAEGLSSVGDGSNEQRVDELDEREYRLRLIRGGLDVIRGDFDKSTIDAFLRVTIEDQPVKDVASELRMSPGAVYMARNRVLTRLREHLDGLLE